MTDLTQYLPIQLAVGTTLGDAINAGSLTLAVAHAVDESYTIYVLDRDECPVFRLNCYGDPIDTLNDSEEALLRYIREAEGDDVRNDEEIQS